MEKITDEGIRSLFGNAGDFVVRALKCQGFALYAYSIDGLTSGGDASEYVFKPLTEHLRGNTMEALYDNALHGGIYNSVADACTDLEQTALKLVNGFCVVLFPGVGAIAFEVKTGEKRSLSAPGGGKYRQRSQGCLYGNGAYQHQRHSPSPSHTGTAAG